MNKQELELILKEGEGQFIEFKENLDNRFAKEVVAFSNASGGKVFLGITDKKEIKGIEITNKLKSKIIDIARNCDPSIILNLKEFENILIVKVPEGKNKPYQCSDGFFMRIGSNSQKLTRDQIIEFSIKEGKIKFDEQICSDFDFKDLDNMKFEDYLRLAGITKNISREKILRNLNVLTDKGMTNAGVLFFAKEPYKYISSSRVRCIHFNDDKRVEILDKKEVDLGIIGNMNFAINYIKERVPVRYEIKDIRRKEFPEYPLDAYREAIINAIIHKDYFSVGDVAVEKLKNQIIINNPGGLLPSFPKGQFGVLSYPRNKLLVDLLSRTELMERAGTGIKRIRDACALNKNKVKIKPLETYFFVEIFPSENYLKVEDVPDNVPDNVPDKRRAEIITLIKDNNKIIISEISIKLKVNEKTIKRDIEKLKQEGKIKRVGPQTGGRGYWKILR